MSDATQVAWECAFRLPDRRPIHEWAAENVSLPPVLTKTGAFDVSGSRHFIAPMDALKADSVREVNIRAPVRSGKTLIADVSVPWAVVNDNASVLWVFQKDDVAREHAELRAWPTLESVKSVREMMPLDRHKKRTQEIVFSNGLPLFICGPAIGNLQSRGFKWVVCDEPWLYKPGILEEAKSRLGDFVRTSNSKLLCISQAGTEDDDWETQFNSGAISEWIVPCSGCGKYFEPKWSAQRPDGSRWGIRWESEKVDGEYDDSKAISTLRFECEHCGHVHLDNERTRALWNSGGRYLTGPGDPSRLSFHWQAVIDYPWRELLLQWFAARKAAKIGNVQPTITFFQKRLALPKSESTAHEGYQSFKRLESVEITEDGRLWEGEVARFLTVDRQEEDVYWATIRAWGADGESRRLWFGKLFGEAEISAKQSEFKVPSSRVFVDSGYRPKGDAGVYAMCIRNGWVSLKGTDKPFFIHYDRRNLKPGEQPRKVQKFYSPVTYGIPGGSLRGKGAMLIHFASQVCGDKVHELIDAGMWIEPHDSDSAMEREYKVQMAAEFKKSIFNKNTGRKEMVWRCPSGNNHAFDCSKMQVTAAMICDLL